MRFGWRWFMIWEKRDWKWQTTQLFSWFCAFFYIESAFAKFSESKQINVVVMLQILYKYNCVNLVPTYQLELYFYFSYIIYSWSVRWTNEKKQKKLYLPSKLSKRRALCMLSFFCNDNILNNHKIWFLLTLIYKFFDQINTSMIRIS